MADIYSGDFQRFLKATGRTWDNNPPEPVKENQSIGDIISSWAPVDMLKSQLTSTYHDLHNVAGGVAGLGGSFLTAIGTQLADAQRHTKEHMTAPGKEEYHNAFMESIPGKVIEAGQYLNDFSQRQAQEHGSLNDYANMGFIDRITSPKYILDRRGARADLATLTGNMLPFAALGEIAGPAAAGSAVMNPLSRMAGNAGLGMLSRALGSEFAQGAVNNAIRYLPSSLVDAASNAAEIYPELKKKGMSDADIGARVREVAAEELPYDIAANAIFGNVLSGKITSKLAGANPNLVRKILAAAMTVPVEMLSEGFQEQKQTQVTNKALDKPYSKSIEEFFLNPPQEELASRGLGMLGAFLPSAAGIGRAYDEAGAMQRENGIDRVMNAIAGQESGGDYTAENGRTGAAGKYQIMPENWPVWAEEAGLGADALQTPENQEIVARYKIGEYYDKYNGDAKKIAEAWYGGEGAVDASEEAKDAPQGNGNEPSLNEYSDSVLENMGYYNMPTQDGIDTSNLSDSWQSFLPELGGVLHNKFGVSPVISSAGRTAEHNAEVNGSENSYHIIRENGADAIDVVFDEDLTDAQRQEIEEYLQGTGLFEEAFFHDAGSGDHLHLGGLKAGASLAGQEAPAVDGQDMSIQMQTDARQIVTDNKITDEQREELLEIANEAVEAGKSEAADDATKEKAEQAKQAIADDDMAAMYDLDPERAANIVMPMDNTSIVRRLAEAAIQQKDMESYTKYQAALNDPAQAKAIAEQYRAQYALKPPVQNKKPETVTPAPVSASQPKANEYTLAQRNAILAAGQTQVDRLTDLMNDTGRTEAAPAIEALQNAVNTGDVNAVIQMLPPGMGRQAMGIETRFTPAQQSAILAAGNEAANLIESLPMATPESTMGLRLALQEGDVDAVANYLPADVLRQAMVSSQAPDAQNAMPADIGRMVYEGSFDVPRLKAMPVSSRIQAGNTLINIADQRGVPMNDKLRRGLSAGSPVAINTIGERIREAMINENKDTTSTVSPTAEVYQDQNAESEQDKPAKGDEAEKTEEVKENKPVNEMTDEEIKDEMDSMIKAEIERIKKKPSKKVKEKLSKTKESRHHGVYRSSAIENLKKKPRFKALAEERDRRVKSKENSTAQQRHEVLQRLPESAFEVLYNTSGMSELFLARFTDEEQKILREAGIVYKNENGDECVNGEALFQEVDIRRQEEKAKKETIPVQEQSVQKSEPAPEPKQVQPDSNDDLDAQIPGLPAGVTYRKHVDFAVNHGGRLENTNGQYYITIGDGMGPAGRMAVSPSVADYFNQINGAENSTSQEAAESTNEPFRVESIAEEEKTAQEPAQGTTEESEQNSAENEQKSLMVEYNGKKIPAFDAYKKERIESTSAEKTFNTTMGRKQEYGGVTESRRQHIERTFLDHPEWMTASLKTPKGARDVYGHSKSDYQLVHKNNNPRPGAPFEFITLAERRYWDYLREKFAPAETVQDQSAPTQEQPTENAEQSKKEELPTESVQEQDNKANQHGSETTILTDDGQEIQAKYKVVEAENLVTSHSAKNGFAVNSEYPAELQPRDRQRVGMKQQITEISQNLRPEDLGESRNVNQGAPVVRTDNVVYNGNGRAIAITRAYAQADHGIVHGTESANKYRAWLEEHAAEFGYTKDDIQGMKHPVLVREVQTELTPEGVESVIGSTAGGFRLGASEQAKSDAPKIKASTFALYVDGDITSAANRDFISGILSDILGKDEWNAYLDKDGHVNADGIQRVKRAIFQAAYGDNELIAKMAESTDDNIRNVSNALLAAAPRIARLNRQMEAGTAYDYPLAKTIADAVKRLDSLRQEGKPVDFFLNEQSIFDETQDTNETRKVLAYLDENIRRQKKIAQLFSRAAEIIENMGDPRQESLIASDRMTMEDVIDHAIDDVKNGGQNDLFTVADNQAQDKSAQEPKAEAKTVPQEESSTTQSAPERPASIPQVEVTGHDSGKTFTAKYKKDGTITFKITGYPDKAEKITWDEANAIYQGARSVTDGKLVSILKSLTEGKGAELLEQYDSNTLAYRLFNALQDVILRAQKEQKLLESTPEIRARMKELLEKRDIGEIVALMESNSNTVSIQAFSDITGVNLSPTKKVRMEQIEEYFGDDYTKWEEETEKAEAEKERERIAKEEQKNQQELERIEQDWNAGKKITGREFVALCDKYGVNVPLATKGVLYNKIKHINNRGELADTALKTYPDGVLNAYNNLVDAMKEQSVQDKSAPTNDKGADMKAMAHDFRDKISSILKEYDSDTRGDFLERKQRAIEKISKLYDDLPPALKDNNQIRQIFSNAETHLEYSEGEHTLNSKDERVVNAFDKDVEKLAGTIDETQANNVMAAVADEIEKGSYAGQVLKTIKKNIDVLADDPVKAEAFFSSTDSYVKYFFVTIGGEYQFLGSDQKIGEEYSPAAVARVLIDRISNGIIDAKELFSSEHHAAKQDQSAQKPAVTNTNESVIADVTAAEGSEKVQAYKVKVDEIVNDFNGKRINKTTAINALKEIMFDANRARYAKELTNDECLAAQGYADSGLGIVEDASKKKRPKKQSTKRENKAAREDNVPTTSNETVEENVWGNESEILNEMDALLGKSRKSKGVESEIASVNNELFNDAARYDDQADDILRELRHELNKLSANKFFDPKIYELGLKYGLIVIRRGARSFKAWAQEMSDKIGETIQPWLKSIWQGIMTLPKNKGFDEKRMRTFVQFTGTQYVKGNKTFESVRNVFVDEYGQQAYQENEDYMRAAFEAVSAYYNPDAVMIESAEEGEVVNNGESGPEEANGGSATATAGNTGRTGRVQEGTGVGGPADHERAGESERTDQEVEGPAAENGEGVSGVGNPGGIRAGVSGETGRRAGSESARENGDNGREGSGGRVSPVVGRGGRTDGGRTGEKGQGSDSVRTSAGGTYNAGEDQALGGTDRPELGINTENYHIEDANALFGGTPKVRFARNRRAIEVARDLIATKRQPTQEEKDAMAAYTGWGSLAQQIFGGTYDNLQPEKGWEKEAEWLRDTLDKDEWESARRSVINAHYTSPIIVQKMWDMIRRMGFKGGRVLEPSMGVGNFFGFMPKDLKDASSLFGIEMDSMTGNIAKMLYPRANIQISPYESVRVADGTYDLIVGNVPFRDKGPADRRYDKFQAPLHDYFFLKGIDELRPGGLMVAITSKGTMDKVHRGIRLELERKAELIDAYRFPTGAFKEYAGTDVVTDLLIFRKREKPILVDVENVKWLNTRSHESDVYNSDAGQNYTYNVNEYYEYYPDHVLGTIGFGRASGKAPGLAVTMDKDKFSAQLDGMVDSVSEGVYEEAHYDKNITYVSNNARDRIGTLQNVKGKLYVSIGLESKPMDASEAWKFPANATDETINKRIEELKDLVRLREAYVKLEDAEKNDAPDMEKLRKELKKIYDAHVKKYCCDKNGKPLTVEYTAYENRKEVKKTRPKTLEDTTGLKMFKRANEPNYYNLCALQRKDGKPAKILTDRVMRTSTKNIENPTINEALMIQRNKSMRIDVDEIAKAAHVSVDDVLKELKGFLFKTPTGDYQTADQYLSGNVRRKLREAQAALDNGDKAMEQNVEALKKVIPEDVPYYDISVSFGASWIDLPHYKEFIAGLIGTTNVEAIDITRNNSGSWKVKFNNPTFNASAGATMTYGTDRIKFDRLLTHALNHTKPMITSKDEDGNTYRDDEAIAKAVEKIDKLNEVFTTWLWEDENRKIEMVHNYNEIMNNVATPKYDGSFLDMAGMMLTRGDKEFDLRQHQINAIYRGLVNGRGLFAHEVGTGKTYTMGGLALEARRFGLAKKPLILAHNANSQTVANEIQEMYPGAKILYISGDSKTVKKDLMRAKMDDWDLIVMPHSKTPLLTLTEQTLDSLAADIIAELEDDMQEAAEAEHIDLDEINIDNPDDLGKIRSQTVKDLVRARLKIKEQIRKAAFKASKEGAIPFEELGIDMIIVDESHTFKKPPFSTKMTVKGLQKDTSDGSIQLNFLSQYVQGMNDGRGIYLFTGTPITNTVTEMYHNMKYIMPNEMKEAGVYHFDDWFNAFAQVTSNVEYTATGENETIDRLNAFVNVAELRKMVGQFMDIVFAEDMPEFHPRTTASGKTLTDKTLTDEERDYLINGRDEDAVGLPYMQTINEVIPMNKAQKGILNMFVEYAHEWKEADKKRRKEIMVGSLPQAPIFTENAVHKAAMDARMYNPDIDVSSQDSKEKRVIKNVLNVYNSDPRTTQVIMMDVGMSDATKQIPRDERGYPISNKGEDGKYAKATVRTYNLQKGIIEGLVAQGIPREEIAVVGGNMKPEVKAKIAEKVNHGIIRVVIGSTATLGTGVNMQSNLKAIHHLDAPWMPGDLEQRNGRILRQGNHWNTVLEYRYITEKLDGRRWQVLATKRKFIRAFMRAEENLRILDGDAVDMSTEDSGSNDLEESLSKATGDPRHRKKKILEDKVAKLKKAKSSFDAGIESAKFRLKKLRGGELDNHRNTVAGLEKIQDAYARYKQSNKDSQEITIKGKRYTKREDANAAIEKAFDAIDVIDKEVKIGEFAGLDLYGAKLSNIDRGVYARRIIIKPRGYEMDGVQCLDTLNSVSSKLGNIDSALKKAMDRVQQDERDIATLEKQVQGKFQREDLLKAKEAELFDLIWDLQIHPVPPPQWLVEGAPVDTDVVIDGKHGVVLGYTVDGTDDFYVRVKFDDNSRREIPWQNVTDSQGMQMVTAPEGIEDSPEDYTPPPESEVKPEIPAESPAETAPEMPVESPAETAPVETPAETAETVETPAAEMPAEAPAEEAPAASDSYFLAGDYIHTKTGEAIPQAKLKDRVPDAVYKRLKSEVKKHNGYYSRFAKSFFFKNATDRDAFVKAMDSELDGKYSVDARDARRLGELVAGAKVIEDESALTTLQRTLMGFGRDMGVNVRFFRGNPAYRGRYINGTVYLNVNSNMPLNKVFWHEASHWLQENNPQLYKDVLDAVKGIEGISRPRIEQYKKDVGQSELTDDEVISEMIADAMSTVKDRVAIMREIGKNRSLAERFISWVQDVMQRFISAFRRPGINGLTKEQEARMTAAFTRLAGSLRDSDGNKIFGVDRGGRITAADGGPLVVPRAGGAYSIKVSDNSTQSFGERIRNLFHRDNAPESGRSRAAMKAALEKITDVKIKFGKTDPDMLAVYKGFEGVLRSQSAYDWQEILPMCGRIIAKKLGLQPSSEMANHIGNWIMTGAPGDTSTEAQIFQEAMKKNPELREMLLDAQALFLDYRNATAMDRAPVTFGKPKSKTPFRDLINRAYDQFVEELGPMERLLRGVVEKSGVELTASTNPLVAFRLHRGAAGVAMNMLEGEGGKEIEGLRNLFPNVNWYGFRSLQRILESVGATDENVRKDFSRYCVACHVLDIHGKNDEIRQQQEPLKAKLAELNAIEEKTEENLAEINDLKQEIESLEKKIMETPQTREDCEEIIKTGRKKFGTAQEDLVNYSLTLLDIMRDSGLISERRFTQLMRSWPNYVPLFREFENNENINFGDSLKHVSGSARTVVDPIQSIIRNTYQFTRLSSKNKAKQVLANLCRISDVGSYVEIVDNAKPDDNTTISFRENGQIRYLQTDPAVVQAVNNMRPESVSDFQRLLRLPSQIARLAFTTASPNFAVRNVARDAADAFIYSKYAVTPWDIIKGTMSAIRKEPIFYEWMAAGGGQTSIVSVDRDYTQSTIDKLTKAGIKRFASPRGILNLLQLAGEYSEYGTRVATYQKTKQALLKERKAGYDAMLEAALESRDLMDFARGGKAGRHWNNWAIFANAAIQGMDKAYRTYNPTLPGNRKKAMMATARLIFTGILPALALFMWNAGDDKYDELPEWQKDKHWIITLGDTIIRIPKGQDAMLQFCSNLVERSLNHVYKKREFDGKKFLTRLAEDLLPDLLPTAVLPLIENWANYSFFADRAIVPGYLSKLSPEEQYRPDTPSLIKMIGQASGISPLKIEHAIQGYLGAPGMTAIGTLPDVVKTLAFGGRPLNTTKENMPIISGFLAMPYRNPQSVQDYYTALDEQTRLHAKMKLTKKRPEGFDPALYKRLTKIQPMLQKLTKQERSVIADDKLTYDQRREKQMAIQRKRIDLVKRAIKK